MTSTQMRTSGFEVSGGVKVTICVVDGVFRTPKFR